MYIYISNAYTRTCIYMYLQTCLSEEYTLLNIQINQHSITIVQYIHCTPSTSEGSGVPASVEYALAVANRNLYVRQQKVDVLLLKVICT